MINLKASVYTALSGICTNVSFYHPESFENFPCISYYEITNKETNRADDGEYASEIEFIVDIWSKDASDISSLAISVNTAMQDIGFKRTASRDMYEKDTKIYHKNMKFTQTICE